MFSTTTMLNWCVFALVLCTLVARSDAVVEPGCDTGVAGRCHNRKEALRLKVLAIATILIASIIGIGLPLFSRSVPFLQPDRNLFVIVKAFASGVILATGFMHVLPDSFDMLTSPCLKDNPWHNFPFTTFIAMLSAVLTLMIDSFMMTYKSRKMITRTAVVDHEDPPCSFGHGHGHGHGHAHAQGVVVPVPMDVESKLEQDATLLRHRIVAQMLEMGIVVHSVVIGLSMGASDSPCTVRPLIAALCFHQLFEGMGLGGCIIQAEYNNKIKAIMAFFFATTTPFGIALGIGLMNVYEENSPTSLIVVGVLNACSSGLLIYMALVELLAADFLGPRLQRNARLQAWAYLAAFLGMGGMSLMAKWA